jgi:hypothetical protein
VVTHGFIVHHMAGSMVLLNQSKVPDSSALPPGIPTGFRLKAQTPELFRQAYF